MQSLIRNSIHIVTENAQNCQRVYNWMDSSELITEKLRIGKDLTNEQQTIYNEIVTLCRRVQVEEPIVLYRGLTSAFDPLLAERQPNSTSPSQKTAQQYGPYVIKIVVPTGSFAFYTSVWQHINDRIGRQNEKEVLLLPGKFELDGEKDGMLTYLYSSL